MSGLLKEYELKNITVKINNNMRSASYGDSPSMSRKRHRSVNRYDSSSDEQGLSKHVRCRARTPHSPRASEIDRFGQSMHLNPTYKVLCVSALHPEAKDEQVKEILYFTYSKFGAFSVKISHVLDERMAYVCFRSSEDAKKAQHSKPRIRVLDKIALVAPIYESHNSTDYHESTARHSLSQNFSPDFERYYSVPTEVLRPHPVDRFYERLPYSNPPYLQQPQVFQEIGLQPLHCHELMIPRQPLLHHLASISPHLGQMRALYEPPRHLIIPPCTIRPCSQPSLMNDKKDKFPNYLHHIPPEDDPLATRTLFVGNLELSILEEELNRLFSRYGVIEDIDIKRPLPGTGNSYAFVRYQNLDMAHKAKVELSGQYIGRYQCKIGYGKSIPSLQIWVGGLGPWISLAELEREFDRFGVINKIKYVEGDTYAIILFENIVAATAAVNEMRGAALGNPEHKLRTDYADEGICVSPTVTYSSNTKSSQDDIAATERDLPVLIKQEIEPDDECPHYSSKTNEINHTVNNYSDDIRKFGNSLLVKQHSVSDISSPRSIDRDIKTEEEEESSLDSVHTLEHLAYKCFDVWHGCLVIKNFQYPAKCHLTYGDSNVIKSMMNGKDGITVLRITEGLRLDGSELKDVTERIMTDDIRAIFLAMPYSATTMSYDNNSDMKIKPLCKLVFYLKQQKSAGIITIKSRKNNKLASLLYVFPPCEYSAKLLKQSAKNLSSETLNDDHLVMVVVGKGILL